MGSMFRSTLRLALMGLLLISMTTGIGMAAEASRSPSPNMLALQGRWIRTDAPYVIELSYAQDGSLQAAYFNPRPIHVGKTETAEQDGLVQILIELQDVKYPGSTYVLTYDRPKDILKGIYFHPVSRQSYNVTFVRQSTNR